MPRIALVALFLSLVIWTVARAGDPLTLTATGNNVNTVSANGSNLIDLAGNLINSDKQFTSLNNQSISGSLRYGSLNNAVLFSRNSAGTSATVSIPSTGFSKTFTAATQDDLQNQVEDFFKKNGASEYADFLKSVNAQTTLGVTDGNPLSATALAANASFYRFGFQSPRFDIGEGPALPAGTDLDLEAGSSHSADADGWYGHSGIGSTFRINDRVGFSVDLDFLYRSAGGAQIYELMNTDALPIMLVAPTSGGGIGWTLTPAFVVGFGGSWDLAAGGFPIGGQITSCLSYRTGPWTFILADQYGYYNSLPVTISDFKFESSVDQSIFKNGVQIIRTFGRGFIDAGVTYTNFLNDAAVDGYWTPEVGIGTKFNSNSGIRIGYHGDFGQGFDDNGADLQLFFSY